MFRKCYWSLYVETGKQCCDKFGRYFYFENFRIFWASYFDNLGVLVAFWSATEENERLKHEVDIINMNYYLNHMFGWFIFHCNLILCCNSYCLLDDKHHKILYRSKGFTDAKWSIKILSCAGVYYPDSWSSVGPISCSFSRIKNSINKTIMFKISLWGLIYL